MKQIILYFQNPNILGNLFNLHKKGNVSKMKTLNKKTIFETKFLNMIKTEYKNKNNDDAEWFHVERVNNPDIVMIVPVIDTDDGTKLVVTKEYRVPIEGYEYGFPAGIVDEGESVEDAIRRELYEETGLNLNTINILTPKLFNSAGMTNESVHIALVTADGTISTENNEASEDIEVLTLSSEEITKLLQRDDIKMGAKAWLAMYTFTMIVEYHYAMETNNNILNLIEEFKKMDSLHEKNESQN